MVTGILFRDTIALINNIGLRTFQKQFSNEKNSCSRNN
jgi:hypothetical protein